MRSLTKGVALFSAAALFLQAPAYAEDYRSVVGSCSAPFGTESNSKLSTETLATLTSLYTIASTLLEADLQKLLDHGYAFVNMEGVVLRGDVHAPAEKRYLNYWHLHTPEQLLQFMQAQTDSIDSVLADFDPALSTPEELAARYQEYYVDVPFELVDESARKALFTARAEQLGMSLEEFNWVQNEMGLQWQALDSNAQLFKDAWAAVSNESIAASHEYMTMAQEMDYAVFATCALEAGFDKNRVDTFYALDMKYKGRHVYTINPYQDEEATSTPASRNFFQKILDWFGRLFRIALSS
ncbi:MAG: hypothetical protein Q3972_08725 [Corynebacterium sp.]|nr:hypothetical protein [Corynebacterium sp.]